MTSEDQADYEFHTAPRDDFNEGWVWIKSEALKDALEGHRRIVRITKGSGGKSVYCEALYADEKDIVRFNETRKKSITKTDDRLIFLSGWHRQFLEIKENFGKQNLRITVNRPPRSLWWQVRACTQHPQVVVLLATALAIIGAGLGLIGVGLGLIGIKEWGPAARDFGIGFVVLGGFVSFVGVVSLFKRR
jgi:hypothetical protein